MAYVHIAHDCMVGSNTIMANNATLGGHAAVEALLGIEADVVECRSVGAPHHRSGGFGDDELRNNTAIKMGSNGGPGNDILFGGSNKDTLNGGSGFDTARFEQTVIINLGTGIGGSIMIGGEGPPLLLVHGWPETWYAWRLMMPAPVRPSWPPR